MIISFSLYFENAQTEDIALDVGEECMKYGKIDAIRIPIGTELDGSDNAGEQSIIKDHATNVLVSSIRLFFPHYPKAYCPLCNIYYHACMDV